MKKYILFLLLICVFQANSQEVVTDTTLTETQTEDIKNLFVDYYKIIKTEPKDWDKIIDFTYPELFNLLPKSTLAEQIKESFSNDLFVISFDKMELKEIKQSFRFKEIIYTKVLYKSVMSFRFLKSEDQSEAEFNDYVEFMQSIYTNQFKDSKVTKTGNEIKISGDKTIIAIHTKKYVEKPCYMIEFLKDNKMYYEMFLPKEVAEEIASNF